jgi:hypothetical protein
MTAPIEHIPPGYRSAPIGPVVLWARSEQLTTTETRWFSDLVDRSFTAVRDLLAFTPTRRIHVVVYADVEDAFAGLGRRLPPTFFLSPLHTATAALIALHAESIEANDEVRVRRHLCHELAHVFAAERTGSLKRLGDGNQDMRICTWVNEGFAECVASMAGDRPDVVERAAALAASSTAPSSRELDEKLDNLLAPDRSRMFAHATTNVWRATEARGIRFVFAHLDAPARW